ncbi:MAG: hypothetical protein PHX74_11870 [Candidatus Sumerlaeales bacterium]|nr:hypothetical protein [Candidatus Sumerlaeales bacterium]
MRMRILSLAFASLIIGMGAIASAQNPMMNVGMPGMPGMPVPGDPGAMGMGMQGMGMGMQQAAPVATPEPEPVVLPGSKLPWLATDPTSTASLEATEKEKNPPPLSEEGKVVDASVVEPDTPAGQGISIASDNDVYVFFYRELEENGDVRREKLRREDYIKLKESVVLALMLNRLTEAQKNAQSSQSNAQTLSTNAQELGQLNRTAGGTRYNREATEATTAATMANLKAVMAQRQAQDYYSLYNTANWDFYFHQKELHYRYVRDSAFAGFEGDIPEPAYSTSNLEEALKDDKEQYEELSQEYATQQRNEILDFFDRLEKREDNRRAYIAWHEDQKHNTVKQAEAMARRQNGRTWDANTGDINIDDWYRGTNIGSTLGTAITIDNQEYVFGREPYNNLNEKQIGVQSTRLTPYDVVGRDGYQIKYTQPAPPKPLPPNIPTDREYDIVGSD